MEKHSCSVCGNPLKGTSNKFSKTQNRVSRKLPNLCVKCNERVIRLAKRFSRGEIKQDEIEIRYLPYVLEMREKL